MAAKLCLFLLSLATASLYADAPEQVTPPPTPSYEATFFKMILTLAGLLCLVLVTIWALKKFSHGRFGSFGSQKNIVILERKNLSPKTLLYLVEVDGKKILLSESQLEVRMLLQPHDQELYE